jgi:Nuclease-related domain
MQEIEKLNSGIMCCVISIAMMPLVFYASYLSRGHFGVAGQADHVAIIYGLIWLIFSLYSGKKLQMLLKKRHAYRLGLDCEMFVGQELNNLMGAGYRVYHDIPAKGFNIDHVVVGRNGVFAVETKGPSKPKHGGGSPDVTVEYDGRTLKFPDWIDTGYLDQARRQAKWLSQRLSGNSRESIPVKPVLLIAGWRIEKDKNRKKGRDDVLVLSGNEACQFISTEWTHTTLSDESIQRIGDVLEEVCRDVEPIAYRQKETSQAWPRKLFARIGPAGRIDRASTH